MSSLYVSELFIIPITHVNYSGGPFDRVMPLTVTPLRERTGRRLAAESLRSVSVTRAQDAPSVLLEIPHDSLEGGLHRRANRRYATGLLAKTSSNIAASSRM